MNVNFNLSFHFSLIDFFQDCTKSKEFQYQRNLNEIEKFICRYYNIKEKDLYKQMSYLYTCFYESKEEFAKELTKIKQFVKVRK